MATEIIPKRCSKCKETKPITEFYKDRSRGDGIQTCCKSCLRAYERSEGGRAVVHKAGAKYRRTLKGKITKAKYQKAYQQSERGKAVQRKGVAKFKTRNPNQIKARSAVKIAIRAGRLPRPDTLQCHYCEAKAEQYHHYLGYEPEFWLDVVPACKECHLKEHRKVA